MSNLQLRVKLPEEFAIVQIFFNLIPDNIFLDCLEGMLNGVDISYNGIGCEVPNEEDESSPKTGMLFYVREEEKWISNEKIKNIYDCSIKRYCDKYPEDSIRSEKILKMAHDSLI